FAAAANGLKPTIPASHYVELAYDYPDGLPVARGIYKVTDSAGAVYEGKLDDKRSEERRVGKEGSFRWFKRCQMVKYCGRYQGDVLFFKQKTAYEIFT